MTQPRGLLTNNADIAAVLTAVGELIAADGVTYAIVIIGGAALNLSGIIGRPTNDVDILAWRTEGKITRPPDLLPLPLVRAIGAVADRFGLPADWLNTLAASQWDTGLPPGLTERVRWRDYAALTVGVIDRYDLIFFKVYAAADSGPRDRHYQDLLALRPTGGELTAAIAWVRTQDPSVEFAGMLENLYHRLQLDLPPNAS
jgi:hypothetical protein